LVKQLQAQEAPIYQDKEKLEEFLQRVIKNVQEGFGYDSVYLFRREGPYPHKPERPAGLVGLSNEGVYQIVETASHIYYGEIRQGTADHFCGMGIKVLKSTGNWFEGWHVSNDNMNGDGRWFGGRSRQIYLGEFLNSKSHG
jgi:hypothetical protein